MSAMPAEPASPLASAKQPAAAARPRLAAVPQGKASTRLASTRRPGRADAGATRRADAGATRRADAGTTRRADAGRPGGLRLTRRGRIVLIAAATLIASLLGFAVASAAMATDHSVPAPPAHHGQSQVVVQPGQTLWSIAVHADPAADPRLVVQRIIQLNGLASGSIAAGQRLWIPQG